MTEYWVSQGNKWCDFCKIYIANNPLSIRTHELGQRHKDSVTKRLASMRKENAAKEKEQKEAARALEQIEAKAKRSYQKDVTSFQETRALNLDRLRAHEDRPEISTSSGACGDGWEIDSASGYYYNQANGYYYDPNSGFYYTDTLGKWVTQEEAFTASQVLSEPKKGELILKKPFSASEPRVGTGDKGATKGQGGPPSALVVPVASVNPKRSVKGAPSSIAVNKRKREDGKKPKVLSKEEATALKAREAAKKRMEEREKPLLGLYRSY